MLNSMATPHAINQNRSTIVLSFKLQGSPNLEKIRSEFITNILEAKDPNGDILYPELKQTVVCWCGFLFWKDVPDFKLPIRVDPLFRENDNDDLTSPKGTAFLGSIAAKEWKFGTEVLWEIIILPGKDDFDIIFCTHHAIGDGYSTIELLDKVSSSNPRLMDQMIKPKVSANSQPKNTILDFMRILFRIPYDGAVYFEAKLRTSRIPDVFNTTTPALTEKVTFAQTSIPIHLPTMKKRAKACGVSFTTFLFNSLTTSIRKLVLKRDGKVRGNILLYFTMPLQNHSHKLRNESAIGFVELPIQEVDPSLRMRMIEAQISNLRNSSLPFITRQLGTLFGLQAPILLRRFFNSASKGASTVTMTNFCFNTIPFSLFGHPFIQVYSTALGMGGSKVVAFVFFTSGDEGVMGISGDSGYLKVGVADDVLAIFENAVQTNDAGWVEKAGMLDYVSV